MKKFNPETKPKQSEFIMCRPDSKKTNLAPMQWCPLGDENFKSPNIL